MKLLHSVAVNYRVEILVIAIKINDRRVARLVTIAILQYLRCAPGPENLPQPRGWILREIGYFGSVLEASNIDNHCSPMISLNLRHTFIVYLLN